MMKTNQSHNHSSLPPYPVIEAATRGNADAMCQIVKHYEGYIAALCTRMAFDDNGVPYLCVDEEMRRRLETRLIAKTLTFKIA